MSHRPVIAVFMDAQSTNYMLKKHFAGRRIDFERLQDYFNDQGDLRYFFYYATETVPETDLERELLGKWKGFIHFLQRIGIRVITKLEAPRHDDGKVKDLYASYLVEMGIDMVRLLDTGVVDEVVIISGNRDFAYPAQLIRASAYKVRCVCLFLARCVATELRRNVDTVLFLNEIDDIFQDPDEFSSDSDPENEVDRRRDRVVMV